MRFAPEKVVELREARGWSRAELATRSGVKFGTLTALELGYNAPSVENVAAVAAALGRPIQHPFFKENGADGA